MGAFGVLHVAEVEVPLCLPVQLPHRVQLVLRHFAFRYSFRQRVLQPAQAVPDLGLPGGNFLLGGGDQCFRRVGAAVAGRAGGHNRLALQRAHQVMAVVGASVLRGLFRHMAAGAVQAHLRVGAGQEGFHFRMLCLQHGRAGSRLLPVLESDPVVVGQDRVRRHLFLAVVGHHRLAVFRREVVLDMALAAVEYLRVDRRHVLAQCLLHIAVGDHDLAVVALVVPVAGVAGDRLGHLSHDVVKGTAVDLHAFLVHHLREVRRLAGNAVGLPVGALRLRDVLQGIGMAPGRHVIL